MSENNPKTGKEVFPPESLCQIGIVVKSIDETIKYYQEVFGFGPFEIRHVDYPTATYYGETAGYRGKRAFFHLGPIQIELIELKDGKTIHESFLRDKGEGLHHIGFLVPDLAEGKRRAERSGLKVTQGFTRPDGTGFAYLDSDRVGGVIFELIQRPLEKTREERP
jgi:catechol 2,3-dioxygenase-like lactoylglutathione lyase family enzyme